MNFYKKMVTRKTAKVKGAKLEYDVQYSLSSIYPDIYRTAERGFQMQYDLRSDNHKVAIECKRLKGISWNQLIKIYKKLCTKAPIFYETYVIFKSNQQPCLVFYKDNLVYTIKEFDTVFNRTLQNHPSTRAKKCSNNKIIKN